MPGPQQADTSLPPWERFKAQKPASTPEPGATPAAGAQIPPWERFKAAKAAPKPVSEKAAVAVAPDPTKQAQAQIKGIIPKEVEAEKKDPYSLERLAQKDWGVKEAMQFLQWRPRWDQPDQVLKDPTWYGRSARYLGGELIGATKAGTGVVLGGYKMANDLAAIFDPTEGMRHDRSLADIWGTLGKDLQGLGGAMKDTSIAAWDMVRHFPEFDADPEKFGDTVANVAMIVDGGIKGAKSMAEMLRHDPAQAARVANNANSGTPSRFFKRKAFEDVYVHTKGLAVAKKVAAAQKEIHDAIEAHAGGIASQIDTAIPSGVIDATAEAQLIRQEFADAVKFPERAHPTLVAAVKAADAAPGMWSWEKVRQLRSAVGRAIGRVEGPQNRVLTRVYKDLTRKLGGTATQYGLETEWNYYNKLSSRYETQFAYLDDKIKESQSGKEVAGHLSRDTALTKEMADNLRKYGLDSKDVMKYARDSSRIMKQQTGWRGTLFRMAYGTPAGVPVMLGARAMGLPWIGSVGAGAVAGYAFQHLVNTVRALKLSPEIIDDILASRELPDPRAVGRGTFPEAPPEVTPTPTPQAPPGAPAAGAAPLPSPPGTAAPAALPAPAPEPTPGAPTVVPEGAVGREPGVRPGTTRFSAIGKQTQARERAARLRAEKGSTAAGGGTLEISGGDVAGKAGEMQEAQRRAGAPDVDTSQFQVPEMEEALRAIAPRAWDVLQKSRKAGKFAEQDYEHYLREMLLRAYEARKMPKPTEEPRYPTAPMEVQRTHHVEVKRDPQNPGDWLVIEHRSTGHEMSPVVARPHAFGSESEARAFAERLRGQIKPTEERRVLLSSPTGEGNVFRRRTSMADYPERQLPPYIEELGKKFGISHFFLGAEMRSAMGLNIASVWRRSGIKKLIQQGTSPTMAEIIADHEIRNMLDTIPGLTDEEKLAAHESIRKGGSVVFLAPDVKGRGTAIHEVFHTIFGEELEEDLTGPDVTYKEVQQLMNDSRTGGATTRDFPARIRRDPLGTYTWIKDRKSTRLNSSHRL